MILSDHVSPKFSGHLTPASDIASGSTSVCQKAIIFLTKVLGSGADTSVTKRLPRENRGILCNVPDGSDLSLIMACYYKYFATGQEICQPSFTRYRVCLPAHDTVAADPRLLGITGINLNVISRAPSGAARANVLGVARRLLGVLMSRLFPSSSVFLDAINSVSIISQGRGSCHLISNDILKLCPYYLAVCAHEFVAASLSCRCLLHSVSQFVPLAFERCGVYLACILVGSPILTT